MILYKRILIDQTNLARLIGDAFRSPPWNETLSEEECARRAGIILAKRDVQCFVAEVDGDTGGVVLTDAMTLNELSQERGTQLADWASKKGWTTIGWGRETLILREYQSLGIGTALREKIMSHLAESRPYEGLFTRMRDDNVRVIRIAERFGYSRTGIRTKSSLGPNIWHEFWYRTF